MRKLTNEFDGLRLIFLDKTRTANPSEWRGNTEDNFKIYVRFLSGELTIGVGDTLEEAKTNQIPVVDFDDDLDYLTTEELRRIMKWVSAVYSHKPPISLYHSTLTREYSV